ncbi:hypothetical protein F441_22049 [Phytophthora nicotianae CJ01A1]|uniref:SWIM-type domain-containing protein n=1 Tax=Phytophthora nicotianae CJ01A1 TaxID=1317063 RepID=W2VQC4_PHYNI|nr:hypothetical protein F441_22049 [Phytophthora nicotianae CJ01A1]
MCYFHVAAKIYKHTRGISIGLAARVFRDIADMHYATSADELSHIQKRCLEEWQTLPQLCAFASYFSATWLNSLFHRWQAFFTPKGFAATNNPVEQFNRAIKRNYTLRACLKWARLSTSFCSAYDPMESMRKAGSLREVSPEKHSIGFLTGAMTPATNTNVVHAVSDRMERVYDPQDRRTKEALPVTACVSTQKARMETAGMPGSGWEVDVDLKICGCRIFFKSGYCIHLIHALSVRNRLDIFCRTRLVYRGRNKARRAQAEQQNAGRPANNGRALQLD